MSVSCASARRGDRVGVIGGGIVGTCTALLLARSGFEVTLLDALPGGGASFGNGGQIAVTACEPMASPGILRKLPGWLRDPLGPVSVDAASVLRLLPWFLRWAAAGKMGKVIATSDAMRLVYDEAFDMYRELLGEAAFDDLMRITGNMFLLRGPEGRGKSAIEDQLRARHGIEVERLSPAQIAAFDDQITTDVRGALYLPRNGLTVSPRRLLLTLLERYTQAGGIWKAERVLKILPEHRGFLLVASFDNYRFDRVVVSAGVWSADLLAPLGVRVPLETMRGYHLHVPAANRMPRCPVSDRERGCAVTPMEDGLRIGGTVEFADRERPMSEVRARLLGDRAQAILPGLSLEGARMWMGHRPCLPDGLPIVDEAPTLPGMILAFGHGHFGMTGAAVTARWVRGILRGEDLAPKLRPFSARRFRGACEREAS